MKRTFQGKISNILAVFLILPILFLSFPFVVSATSISDLQDELNALDQKIAEQEKAIKKKQAEAASLSNQVATFNSQIYQTQLEINRTQADINLTQAEIDKLNSDIAKKESELKIQKKTLEKAAVLLYEEQDRSMLELVLTSDSINEIVDRSEYLNTVQVKIDESMVEIDKIQKKLAEKKKEQENKKKDLEGKNAELSVKRASEQDQRNNLNILLRKTRSAQATHQALAANLKEAVSSISGAINAILASRNSGSGSAIQYNGQLMVNNNVNFHFYQTDYGQVYDSGYTIRSSGCLITSITMIAKYYGQHGINPYLMAQNLQFTNGNLIWSSAQSLYGGRVVMRNNPYSSINWGLLDQELAKGHPIILHSTRGANGYNLGGSGHWIVAYGKSGGKYLIADPAWGTGAGYNSSWIDRMIIYY